MLTTPPSADAESRLRRVSQHVEELRRAGRDEDAEAVGFVRDLAEQALTARRRITSRELLTTGDAGLALGISDRTVRNWIAAGRLPGVRRGTRMRIPCEAVREEIERSRVRPSVEPAATRERAAEIAARQEPLGALPPDIGARLGELHDRLEDGCELSPDERAEMVRLEREMAAAAARHLKGTIRRKRPGAA